MRRSFGAKAGWVAAAIVMPLATLVLALGVSLQQPARPPVTTRTPTASPVPTTGPYVNATNAVEAERQFQARFAAALKSFCLRDYPSAHLLFIELESRRPEDVRAGQYVERIFFNSGIEELRTKRPWESVYYFGKVVERNPADAEAKRLLAYAQTFQPGAQLGHAYTSTVDPLVDRTQGCERTR
jgi:hypothetical protein